MGWKQFIRQSQAAARRSERETRASARRSERDAMRRHRELVREHQASSKELARQQAAHEAEEYVNYVAMLVTIHTDCGERWDWRAVSSVPRPSEPVRSQRFEVAARVELNAYNPGFLDKLLGGGKQVRAQLEEAVQQGIAADQQQYESAQAVHRAQVEHWLYQARLGPSVLALDLEACRAALRYCGAFDELEEFETRVTLDAIDGNVATLGCTIADAEIVPTEEVKLTASGKLTTKAMAAGKYWALYQDHVASCALRVARETFAVLPIERAIVNVHTVQLDSTTGHTVPRTILAVHLSRDTIARLNLAAIDPSDSLKNFPHRMKFKKTAGFDQVAAMTSDEQWVTT